MNIFYSFFKIWNHGDLCPHISFRINLVSFSTFRCPLFPKPVPCPRLFFAASYSKMALIPGTACNSRTLHCTALLCFFTFFLWNSTSGVAVVCLQSNTALRAEIKENWTDRADGWIAELLFLLQRHSSVGDLYRLNPLLSKFFSHIFCFLYQT